MITTKSYSFQSRDGVTIHGICMIPERPIAILQMVHGMNEHKERYLSFMEELAGRGYITLMHDNCGHGESVKEPSDLGYCYASREQGMVADVYEAARRIRKKYPELPLILYGHSMGSLIVRAYLKKHDDMMDGLILSGCPSYEDGVPFAKLLVRACIWLRGEGYRSPFMQNLAVGGFNKRFAAEDRRNAWLAVDSSVAEAFNHDPLCQFTYSLNGFLTLLNLESIVYRDKDYQMKNPELPIRFLSGMDDPCYISERKWEQALSRMRQLGYRNVTARLFDGMRHEIHNEPERQLVFDDIDHFCRQLADSRSRCQE